MYNFYENLEKLKFDIIIIITSPQTQQIILYIVQLPYTNTHLDEADLLIPP